MAFQRGNQRQSVLPARAIAYLSGVLTGMTAPGNKTVPLPRQFRGLSPILVSAPSAQPAGVAIAADLLPPNPGDYANGVPPSLMITSTGTGALTGDLLVVQY